MSSPQKFLFLGATGYIGASILEKFLKHPRAAEFQISALVRDISKAEKLKAFGVTSIVGDNSDLDLLQALAKDADVVISVAESTNVPATKAALIGAKRHFEETGRPTIYIHTSGAGAIADCTVHGMHQDSPTYDDFDAAQMAMISPAQLHRPVDLELLCADDEGYIKSYIILPTTVYGVPKGPLADCGIQRLQNSLLTWLVPVSLARGQGGMVGEGRNIWQNVELDELADLYIILYNQIAKDDQISHGRAGLYFAENGAHQLSEVSAIIARTLFEHGKGQSPIPTPFTKDEETNMGPMVMLIGSNAKCKASRARALGWQPTKSTSAFMESAREVTIMSLASPTSNA
ncbi:hypothetical protein B0H17DRAFT_1065455 [Mycena rosella]|uniref:NmrA-like domain-containing protein n=1 Tax=Mycena rosella TaxID=1033263 RepID=A0AAD7DFF7_MYCRO|nr:hypothetical protein B0H17DRAFT_1065455 [Mycena rosella]